MKLKDHLSKEAGFSDLLNYAYFVDDGILINKDGAFLMCYKYRAPDINSASSAELDSLSSNFNRMATLLEDGWMLHIDDLRIPSLIYPEKGHFPEPVSALIDEERRQLYESDGVHYENFQFITFIWKFPLPVVKATRHWFIDGVEEKETDSLSKLLKQFLGIIERCINLLSTHLILEKLNSADLLSYLNTCITGDLLPVSVPPDGCFIDTALSRKPVSGGYMPMVGNKHIHVLSIMGYLNEHTVPGLLEQMGTYPLIYRWSNRFIPLSEATAEKEIKRYQKNWNNKVKGLTGILKEVISGKPSHKINVDALQMSEQTTDALTLNSNRSTRFGFWSSEVVLINENVELLEQATKEISRYLEQSGFSCYKEDVNAYDAWLGTIPGHGSCNVRRLFINSLNLAHVLPLHSIWAGETYSSSASLLPPHSPPVFYAATTGKTPFRWHMDVADVGHALLLGPTGAGKSTFLDFLITQFLRYENAQIFVFDKDDSHKALTYALSGHHYDIGNADELSFCPLADLSSDSKKVRAEQFIEDLVYLQNVSITPDIRSAIYNAIESLSRSHHANSRNLTVFKSEVQNELVRSALQYYTIDGQVKLLDSTKDSLKSGYLHTFEMNWLLNQKPEIYLPVLRYIFDEIESRLEISNGKNPTLIILEEAWLYISHEVFAKKLKDWLKTLRKKNARVVFATQSLSDLYDPTTQSLTSTTATIMESCPTKIYLPNNQVESEMKELYKKMSLSDRQIEIISEIAIPKHHYYIVTPYGNRLIDLGFKDVRPIALSFVGLSKKKSKALLDCIKQEKNEWLFHWLNQNDFPEWATYWKNSYKRNVA
jgi:type IV secretion/conjugal transfer VirB4 family ATPase